MNECEWMCQWSEYEFKTFKEDYMNMNEYEWSIHASINLRLKNLFNSNSWHRKRRRRKQRSKRWRDPAHLLLTQLQSQVRRLLLRRRHPSGSVILNKTMYIFYNTSWYSQYCRLLMKGYPVMDSNRRSLGLRLFCRLQWVRITNGRRCRKQVKPPLRVAKKLLFRLIIAKVMSNSLSTLMKR